MEVKMVGETDILMSLPSCDDSKVSDQIENSKSSTNHNPDRSNIKNAIPNLFTISRIRAENNKPKISEQVLNLEDVDSRRYIDNFPSNSKPNVQSISIL